MNIEKFTDALGEVDDKYVTEALSYKKSKRGRKYIFTFAAAACILLVVAAGDRFLTPVLRLTKTQTAICQRLKRRSPGKAAATEVPE